MNCQTARNQLSPYLDGELSAGERSRLEDHLSTCPDCSLHHEELKQVQRELDSLSRDPVPVSGEFGRRLLDRLRREFHLTGPVVSADSESSSSLPAASSVMAVLTLLVGLLVGTYLGFDFHQAFQPSDPTPLTERPSPASTTDPPGASGVVSFRDAYFELAETQPDQEPTD